MERLKSSNLIGQHSKYMYLKSLSLCNTVNEDIINLGFLLNNNVNQVNHTYINMPTK